MAKIMSSRKFILISFMGSCEPTHLLTIEILSDYALYLKKMVSLALNYVGFTRGEGSTAVTSVYRALKQVMLNVRVFVTKKIEMTDFILWASNRAIALDHQNRDSRAQWLINHKYILNEKGDLVITDDDNPMASLQIRAVERCLQKLLKRLPPDLLIL
ncbi:hypothetical protein A1353_19610 [Methylomonas methanica]|uniref:Uncharacterized protein n=1 Tax=Methylomonas methanica TaxID=421 RepID=A0A177M4Y8_METMH|nr:hypothetical protein [Methylomonas methanica]OAI00150.1 hypothetical protein A1353_19610 [Methylomonas methanica]